jgi:hypothetical protein
MDAEAIKDLEDRREGQVTFGQGQARASHDVARALILAAISEPRHELRQKTRLADPGLAVDEHDSALLVLPCYGIDECSQFGIASDKPGARRVTGHQLHATTRLTASVGRAVLGGAMRRHGERVLDTRGQGRKGRAVAMNLPGLVVIRAPQPSCSVGFDPSVRGEAGCELR